MLVRERLGFDDSEKVVSNLLADSDAVMRGSQWGIPLAVGERSQLDKRVADEQDRADLLDLVYSKHSNAFAGSVLSGEELVVFLKSGASPEAISDVTSRGGVVEFVEFSFADLISIGDALEDMPGIDRVSYDAIKNKIILDVKTASTDKVLSAIDARFGAGSPILVVESELTLETNEVGYGSNTTDPGHPCRPAHCSPVSGGQFYGFCTLGFGVVPDAFQWERGYATAGHCMDPGEPNVRARWISQAGTAYTSTWWRLGNYSNLPNTLFGFRENSTNTDMGFHVVPNRVASNNMFQEDAVHWRPITLIRNWWQVPVNSRVCASWGRQQGAPQCGDVTRSGQYRIDVALDETDLSTLGDSGSPYWLESLPWAAVAVHNGNVAAQTVVGTSVTALPALLDASIDTDVDRESDFVISLYGRALNRFPDQGGYDFWTGASCNISNLRNAVDSFYKGQEFQNSYGVTSFTSLDHVRAMVRKLYRGVLGREPDEPSWTNWSNFIWNAGSSTARWTAWQQTSDSFRNSGEFTTRFNFGAPGEAGFGLCAT